MLTPGGAEKMERKQHGARVSLPALLTSPDRGETECQAVCIPGFPAVTDVSVTSSTRAGSSRE